MKTKKEIINHVAEVGYSKIARKQICAFMIGARLKERNEIINFKIKEDKSFDDFLDWYDDVKYFSIGDVKVNTEDFTRFWYDHLEKNIENLAYHYCCKRGIEDFRIGDKVMVGHNKEIIYGEVLDYHFDASPTSPQIFISIKDKKGVNYVISLDECDFVIKDNED